MKQLCNSSVQEVGHICPFVPGCQLVITIKKSILKEEVCFDSWFLSVVSCFGGTHI